MILGIASLIWGLAFVAQSAAADKIPPFIFNSLRAMIGALFLLGILLGRKWINGQPIFPKEADKRKEMLIGGLVCGLLLTVSVNFQQFGLVYYPTGTASEARGGFLTSLYVILVPLISVIVTRKIRLPLLGAVLLATAGIYMLCLSEGLHNIYLGDILIFLCAISFSFHILAVDRFGASVGGVLLSMLQFLVCGILSLVLSLLTEPAIAFESVLSAAPQILYLGIISSGIGYTLQIIGQKYAEPAVASITMSLESVFAALGGWLISGNKLSLRELFGCALVFLAILVAQIPQFYNKTKEKTHTSS